MIPNLAQDPEMEGVPGTEVKVGQIVSPRHNLLFLPSSGAFQQFLEPKNVAVRWRADEQLYTFDLPVDADDLSEVSYTVFGRARLKATNVLEAQEKKIFENEVFYSTAGFTRAHVPGPLRSEIEALFSNQQLTLSEKLGALAARVSTLFIYNDVKVEERNAMRKAALDKGEPLYKIMLEQLKYDEFDPKKPVLKRDSRPYAVCQEYAGMFVAFVRLFAQEGQKLPSRYAGGYKPQLNQGPNVESAQGRGVIFTSDAHAWPEVYLKGKGWIPFEPTGSPEDKDAVSDARKKADRLRSRLESKGDVTPESVRQGDRFRRLQNNNSGGARGGGGPLNELTRMIQRYKTAQALKRRKELEKKLEAVIPTLTWTYIYASSNYKKDIKEIASLFPSRTRTELLKLQLGIHYDWVRILKFAVSFMAELPSSGHRFNVSTWYLHHALKHPSDLNKDVWKSLILGYREALRTYTGSSGFNYSRRGEQNAHVNTTRHLSDAIRTLYVNKSEARFLITLYVELLNDAKYHDA